MLRNYSTEKIRVSSDSSLLLTSDVNGVPKLWGADWHSHIFANLLAARWNVSTEYEHYDVVDTPVAEALLQTFSHVFAVTENM